MPRRARIRLLGSFETTIFITCDAGIIIAIFTYVCRMIAQRCRPSVIVNLVFFFEYNKNLLQAKY